MGSSVRAPFLKTNESMEGRETMMNNNKAESVVREVDSEAAIRNMAYRILEMRGHRVIDATETLPLIDDDTPLDLLIAHLHKLGLKESKRRAGNNYW